MSVCVCVCVCACVRTNVFCARVCKAVKESLIRKRSSFSCSIFLTWKLYKNTCFSQKLFSYDLRSKLVENNEKMNSIKAIFLLPICLYIYIYIYIYMCVCVCVCIFQGIYIYIYRYLYVIRLYLLSTTSKGLGLHGARIELLSRL